MMCGWRKVLVGALLIIVVLAWAGWMVLYGIFRDEVNMSFLKLALGRVKN